MQMFEEFQQARDAVRRVPGMPATVELLQELSGLRRTVDAAYLDVLRRLVGADEWQADGSRSASAWLARLTNISKHQASAEVSVAMKLPDLPETSAALADGDISFEHAQVINKLARQLPSEHTPDLDKYLVEAAVAGNDPVALRRNSDHLRAQCLPEHAARREQHLYEQRHVHLSQSLDGAYQLNGMLPLELGATLEAALTPLMEEMRRNDAQVDADIGLPRRSATQRRADALVELARRSLDGGELPDCGQERPHVAVTMDYDVLVNSIGLATLDDGSTITPETARRIACDAGVIPILLGAAGQPLDVGRASRTVPTGIRRAVIARDGHCVFDGCDTPPSGCHIHHFHHWSAGGKTSLDNLALACSYHHQLIHADNEWAIEIHAGTPVILRNGQPVGPQADRQRAGPSP